MKKLALISKVNSALAGACLLALTLFSACAKESFNQSPASLFSNVQSLNIAKITLQVKELSPKTEAFMRFENGEFSGFIGCNRFFGNFKASQNELIFSDAGATKMLCEPEIMQLEDALLVNLKGSFAVHQTASGYELKGKSLNIFLSK